MHFSQMRHKLSLSSGFHHQMIQLKYLKSCSVTSSMDFDSIMLFTMYITVRLMATKMHNTLSWLKNSYGKQPTKIFGQGEPGGNLPTSQIWFPTLLQCRRCYHFLFEQLYLRKFQRCPAEIKPKLVFITRVSNDVEASRWQTPS